MKTYYFCEWCGKFYGSLALTKKCAKRDLAIVPYFRITHHHDVFWKDNIRWRVLGVYRKHYRLDRRRMSVQKDNQIEIHSLESHEVGFIKIPLRVNYIPYKFDPEIWSTGCWRDREKCFVYKIGAPLYPDEKEKGMAIRFVSGQYLKDPHKFSQGRKE